MIKNKVNPAAAEGTRSCEGGKGGETVEEEEEEQQQTLPEKTMFARVVRRTGMRSRRQLGHQAHEQSGVRKCWRSFFLGMLVASVEIIFL